MKFPLCNIADIPATGATVVDFFGRQAIVYRANGEAMAVLAICTHLGGPLELKDSELVCPWHGARFDASAGHCLNGPAERGSKAMFLPTRVEDGVLTYVWGE